MADAITDIPTALQALRQFAADPPKSTPQLLRDELTGAAAQMSPVDAIVRASEAMFGNLDELTKPGAALLADLAAIATTFGWHGLGEGGRGVGIVRAASREAGRDAPSGSWPDRADDPAPLARYAPPAPPLSDTAAAPVEPPAE